jgi:hypothetical protein
MLYCEGKKKVNIIYTFNKSKQIFTFDKTPVGVEKSLIKVVDPNSYCWRFSGIGVNNDDSYEYYACGQNPSFLFNGDGFTLYLDGLRLGSAGYQYRRGSQSVSQVSGTTKPNPGHNTDGNCDSCSIDKCTLIVKYQGTTVFEKSGDCPLDFQVACDDDCPPGYIKCNKTDYPGYCCISCSEIKSEITALRSAIRR